MSQILNPWIFNTRLFYTFFTEHRTALKELTAALVGIPKERVLALEELGMWRAALDDEHADRRKRNSYYGNSQNSDTDHLFLGVRLILEHALPVSIYLLPALSDAVSFHSSFRDLNPSGSPPPSLASRPCPPTPRSPSSCSNAPRFPPLFSSAHDFRPLLTPADFQAATPFLRIFLVYENPERENPFFYTEVLPTDSLSSARILNLAALPPAGKDHSPLYAFSRLLTVSRSTELPPLCSRFPFLRDTASLLEKDLKERELTNIFSEHGPFSPAGSRGISAMCSLNRLLLRENRLTDLKKVSQDPEELKKVFQEFQKKGFL